MEKTAPLRTKKTVFLVDDHPLIRDSLSRLIDEEVDLKVSGCTDSAESAITAIERLKPDVIVVDIGLPGKSGLELIRFLMEQNPSALILVLSMHDEAIYTSRALKAGARGYVSKSEATGKVILAIRRLLGGGLYISEAIAESLALGLHRKTIEAAEGELSPLSDRELEVFRMLASGRDTSEIAKTLSVSLKTVQSYCARIKEKLNLRNATELLKRPHGGLIGRMASKAVRAFLGIVVLEVLAARLPAQSLDDANGSIDPKAVQSASHAPDHINLWSQDQAQQQSWMFHFQNTDIIQGQPGFASPYRGANSITPDDTLRETISLDLYFGARIWPGGELYFNPEWYQGYGFDNAHGIADFPNDEAFKVGSTNGSAFIAHLFYKQVIGLGGDQEQISSDQLQLAGKEDISRFTVVMGKLAVGDFFDDNAYSHDQRTQFLGWTFVDSGAFDSTADSFGYIPGVILELNQKNWALRWGGFMVPRDSDGNSLDKDLTKDWQDILELDERYAIGEHPGTVRLLGWLSSAHMGSYWDTVNDSNAEEDITQTAEYRYAYGFALSADQELTKDLGAFARLSWRDGHSEEWAFTDMDRSLAVGVQLAGTSWARPDDVVGLGDTVGELTRGHATYLNNGGLGIVLGDDHLSYAPENVTETYYDAKIVDHVHLAGDFQLVDNPGYNTDRGPVFIFSARLHVQY